jgi:hypothetical protein
MAKLSKDLGAGNLHPRETLFAAGSLGGINAEIIIPSDGCHSFALDLRGTFSLTVEVSGTLDGTNWVPLPVRAFNQNSTQYLALISAAAGGVWVGKVGPFKQLRARVTAYTSGTATATLAASSGLLDDTLQGTVTPLITTTAGATGAATSLTIPAPGAGLRQYLTYLRIVRFATAALTASATPVTITTTNLPGSLAFTCAADSLALGARDVVIQEDFAYPLASVSQNTNTTVVCPATAGVIWRITSGYYVAP